MCNGGIEHGSITIRVKQNSGLMNETHITIVVREYLRKNLIIKVN